MASVYLSISQYNAWIFFGSANWLTVSIPGSHVHFVGVFWVFVADSIQNRSILRNKEPCGACLTRGSGLPWTKSKPAPNQTTGIPIEPGSIIVPSDQQPIQVVTRYFIIYVFSIYIHTYNFLYVYIYLYIIYTYTHIYISLQFHICNKINPPGIIGSVSCTASTRWPLEYWTAVRPNLGILAIIPPGDPCNPQNALGITYIMN